MPIKMGQGGSKSQNIASYCEVTGKSTIQLSSHSKREGRVFSFFVIFEPLLSTTLPDQAYLEMHKTSTQRLILI